MTKSKSKKVASAKGAKAADPAAEGNVPPKRPVGRPRKKALPVRCLSLPTKYGLANYSYRKQLP